MDATASTLLRIHDNLPPMEPDTITGLMDVVHTDSYTTTTNVTSDDASNPFILPWYIQLIYIVAFVFIVIVATGGNVVVIWIVLAHKRMRTVTNYFLVNLAVADALISIFNTAFNSLYMLSSEWPFGLTFCKFSMFTSPCMISASVFTFMAIAIDRYVAILHPLRQRMRAGTVIAVIIVIWVASITIAFPNLLFATTYTWFNKNVPYRTVCYIDWPAVIDNETDFPYSVFIMFVNYVIPLAALALTYSRVGCSLWGSQAIGEYSTAQQETINSKRRVVKMMIVVVVIFAVCWFPQHAFFLITNLQPELTTTPAVQHIYLVAYWLAMSNSMYNPIIYCWMNNKFRKGFKYIFRWLPCITWTHDDSLALVGKGNVIRMSMTETTRCPYSEQNRSFQGTLTQSSPSSGNYRNMLYAPVTRSTEQQV